MNLEDLENVTLETLITRHRDRFELRYSTPEDLFPFQCDRVGNAVKAEIREWRFVTLADNAPGKEGANTFLTGVKDGFTVTMTSAVVGYNKQRGFVFTQSGSLYFLTGPEALIPLDTRRTLAVAWTLNEWGVGATLGVPDVWF